MAKEWILNSTMNSTPKNPVRDLSSVEKACSTYLCMPLGAFSYSKSQIIQVAKYIENQEEHHKKKTFIEEYRKILLDFGLEYDERYIFKPVE